jgi:uncharacterized protein YwlG (UPF0340 family)
MGQVGIGRLSPLQQDLADHDKIEALLRHKGVDAGAPSEGEHITDIIIPVVTRVSDGVIISAPVTAQTSDHASYRMAKPNRRESDSEMGSHRHR